jgi:hypothetical protein
MATVLDTVHQSLRWRALSRNNTLLLTWEMQIALEGIAVTLLSSAPSTTPSQSSYLGYVPWPGLLFHGWLFNSFPAAANLISINPRSTFQSEQENKQATNGNPCIAFQGGFPRVCYRDINSVRIKPDRFDNPSNQTKPNREVSGPNQIKARGRSGLVQFVAITGRLIVLDKPPTKAELYSPSYTRGTSCLQEYGTCALQHRLGYGMDTAWGLLNR